MKIGVLSDTHIPKAAERLPDALYEHFKGVDLILHAGDLVSKEVLDELNGIAPTIAVQGNMDSWDVKKTLPRKKIVQALDFKIGLIHGWGHPAKLIDILSKEFEGVDVVVFGHSHEAIKEERDGVLYFNPGTPTDKVFAPFNSFGILKVNKTIKAEIIKI